jgi:hypothetical protein
MTTILLAVPLFMLAVLGLALGVVLGHRPIKGSCGGCANCIDRRGQP